MVAAPNGRVFADATGATALSQIAVAHSIPETAVDRVTFVFTVERAALERMGVGPDGVIPYYRQDGRWRASDAELVGETADSYVFRTELQALTGFTVAAERTDISVRDVRVDQTTMTAEDPAVVTATFTNDGSRVQSFTATLTANGERLDTRDVTFAAGESTAVTFELDITDSGHYRVAVNGVDAGIVEVTDGVTGAQSMTGVGAPSGDDAPSPWLLLGGVALVGIALFVFLRHDS